MNIHLVNKPFNYIVIDEFYSNEELDLIMQEVQALEPYALKAEKTNAGNEGNKFKKTGKGIFLDEFFIKDRSVSKILNASRKIFSEELCNVFNDFDLSFSHIENSNKDAVLLNYYRNLEKYDAHRDKSTISAVTFFKVGNFEGGNFCFPKYNEKVLFKHNRIVIFNGCVSHQAEPIYTNDSSYRSTIAQFIGYK